MRWTPDKDDELRKLHAAGHSCSVIGRMLGGLTRNAVIGRVHRLKLPGRPPSGGRAARLYGKLGLKAKGKNTPRERVKTRPFPVAPKLPILPIPAAADYDRARIATADLEAEHCRWPVGDPQEAGHDKPLFCGKKRHPGLPYCNVHSARAFQPPPPRRRELPVVVKESVPA